MLIRAEDFSSSRSLSPAAACSRIEGRAAGGVSHSTTVEIRPSTSTSTANAMPSASGLSSCRPGTNQPAMKNPSHVPSTDATVVVETDKGARRRRNRCAPNPMSQATRRMSGCTTAKVTRLGL